MNFPRVACLTIDLEPDLHCPDSRIRLLDEDFRFEGFMSLLKQESVPLTCFVVMSIAGKYLEQLTQLSAHVPVEFAVHSYSHDRSQPATDDELKRSWDEYGKLWNAEPWGYRAPNCLIDEAGIARLIHQGYRYDSSITPSIRFDQYGYDNRKYGRAPFLFNDDGKTLLEFPVACLAGSRLPFILSYIKLFGLTPYRLGSAVMPLPHVAVTYFHAYDLYANEIAGNIPGWKRYAHRRNAAKGGALLVRSVQWLKQQGYRFMTMRALTTLLAGDPELHVRSLNGIEREA